VFWGAFLTVALLCAVPSWVVIDKARQYLRLVTGWDRDSLRQLKTSRIPHRDGERMPDAEIRFVEFSLDAPKAKSVRLGGSFNQWNAAALPLEKERSGHWKVLVPLTKGTHHYAFEVDGSWTLDPKAPRAVLPGREASVRVVP
jgi:1,4-alpha-glucan branching enzyme